MIAKLHALKEHEGFRRYAANTSWLFGEKILRMIVGLFVGLWVARYLGPERFGLFSYAQSFVGLFTAFATLGLDGIVVRELVKNEMVKEELIGTAFYLKVIGAFIALLLLAISTNFTSNNFNTNVLVFIIASATIFQSFNVIDLYFQSKVLGKYIVFSNMTSLLISSIVKVVLILCDAPLIAFAWSIVFDSVVLALGLIYYFFKHSTIRLKNLKFRIETAFLLLKDSWPLVLSGIVVSVYMKIDQVMIKEMLDNETVGQYAAAVRVSELWYFIPTVIASSLFPAILNAKDKSENLYNTRLQRLYDLMVWMGVAIALPLTFLSDWLINLLYGHAYGQAGSVLMIHIWASIFVFLGVASSKWFMAENLQILSFWRVFYGMVMNVVLNFVLIPEYGLQGAAIATLSANFIAAFLFDFFNKKTKQMFYMKLKAFIPIRK